MVDKMTNISYSTLWWQSTDEVPDMETDNITADLTESQDMDLPPSLLVAFTVILGFLLVIGVAGNLLVLSVLIRAQWQARRSIAAISSTTNAYILNLSAADLLFLVFCAPFHGTVYILNHWPFGWLMCKLAHYCQFCTVYASIWILTTMSVDRYVAIGHPLKSVKWRRPTQATRISCIMWLTAAIVSVPWLILYETDEYEAENGSTRIACYDIWSDSTYHYRKWIILFGFLIGFLIPCVIIFCMALLIAESIRLATHQPLLLNTSENGSWRKNETEQGSNGGAAGGGRLRRRRRVGWLVFALSLMFFICWAPHNFSLVWLNFDDSALDWINNHYQAFFIIKLIAHMMTYLNSSINPLLYSIGSSQFFGRLAVTCGLRSRSPTGATGNNCRTFANRTLHANSVLVQFPLSRSNSTTIFKKESTTRRPSPKPSRKWPALADLAKLQNADTKASNPRRTPVIPKPANRPRARRPAPGSSMRKASSAFMLINHGKNSATVLSYQDAVPLITKRLDEAKKIRFGVKASNSSSDIGRSNATDETVVISNLYVENVCIADPNYV